MAFPDFPFPDDLPSFIGHEDVQKYLEDYADDFDILKYIQVMFPLLSLSVNVANL